LRNGFDFGKFGHASQDSRFSDNPPSLAVLRWWRLVAGRCLPLRPPIRYAVGYTPNTADHPSFPSLSASGATRVCDPGWGLGLAAANIPSGEFIEQQ
jgi:hypothetical protein